MSSQLCPRQELGRFGGRWDRPEPQGEREQPGAVEPAGLALEETGLSSPPTGARK